MSLPSHSGNFDVNYYGMGVCGLSNEGYQGQPNGSHSSSNPPGGYLLMNTTKDAPAFSKTRCGNETQYAATEMVNGLSALFTVDQSMTDLSSQTPNDDSLYGYPRSYQQDYSIPTPMSSLLSSTNPSAIADMSHSRVEQKIQNPPGGLKRKSSAVWTGASEVRPGEGRLALALLIKYKPNPTINEMESIARDTGYPLEFVIQSYFQNKSSGPRLREEQILRDPAYFPKLEREILAQPIPKRARIRKDPILPAAQTAADDSRPKDFQCDSCEKGFSLQRDLRRHEKIHRPGEFYCQYCGKCFKRKDHLNNHIRKKHGDLSSSAPQMPVLGNENPDNDPDSGNYSSLGHLSGGAWNFQGSNSWQSSQSGSTSRNSGGLAPSGSSFIGHGFVASLEEICRIFVHKSATEYLKMFTGGEFLKKLGRGSFGSVYEVSLSHGINMDRRSFACKIIRLPRHSRNEATERALNEINIVRVLDHPNIIKFAGACVLNDFLFMNSIPVADSNLNQFLSEPPPLESRISGQQIWKSVDGLASALAYLHNEQIVHFDLKPSNILVRNDTDLTTCTQFILADFGSSQILVSSQMEFSDHAVTPRYCAPEWFEDKGKRGSHCDIFSFGCILAEIHGWTKSRIPRDYEAFRVRSMGFKRNWTYYESLPALNDWFHFLSLHESTGRSDYTSLIMKMLRPNHQERPSAAEVVATLDSITENKARRPENGICDYYGAYIRPYFFHPSTDDIHRNVYLHGLGGVGKCELARWHQNHFSPFFGIGGSTKKGQLGKSFALAQWQSQHQTSDRARWFSKGAGAYIRPYFFHPSTDDIHRNVYLHGLGGVGKSELARWLQNHFSAFFGIGGSTKGQLGRSFVALAQRLSQHQTSDRARSFSKGAGKDFDAIVEDELNWFSQPSNSRSFVVIDALDWDCDTIDTKKLLEPRRNNFPNRTNNIDHFRLRKLYHSWILAKTDRIHLNVLHGLGGAGKSQLAVESARLLAQDVIDLFRLDNPDSKIDNDYSALESAVRQGHKADVKLLLLGRDAIDQESNINYGHTWRCCLTWTSALDEVAHHYFARQRTSTRRISSCCWRLALIPVLGTMTGQTAPLLAVRNGHKALVRLLLLSQDAASIKHLSDRYKQTGIMDDLHAAIAKAELSFSATPEDHLDRAGWINNLANRLSDPYNLTGNMDDLRNSQR